MSKLMGKIFLKGRGQDVFSGFPEFLRQKLYVRYLKSSDSFEFKGLRLTKKDQEADLAESGLSLKDVGEGFSANRVVVRSGILSAMIMADKIDDIVYHWSIGYAAREKLGRRPGDFTELCKRETNFIRKSSGIGSGGDEGSSLDFDSYIDLSVWQYLYNISETILKKVKVLWKKRKWNRGNVSSCWLELERRQNYGGRLVGAKGLGGSGSDFVSESDADFNERIEHNKKVAVAKGYLTWYIETCKEEAKRKGVLFDKEACLVSWREERANM